MSETKPDGVTEPGDFWDAKYRGTDYFYGVRPNAFLVEESYRLNPGSRVLCLGDGEGRNGVWLAEQGHKVTSVDASPRALQKCAHLAMQRGVFLRTECTDLRGWSWRGEPFDAVVAIYFHLLPQDRTPVFRAAFDALAEGGLFLMEAFSKDQLGFSSGGPKNIDLLYRADEVSGDFSGGKVLMATDDETELAEGTGHNGPASVSRLLVAKE